MARSPFLPLPEDRLLERFTRCIAGLALFGLGCAMFFASDLGVAPWDVFHQGLSERVGIPVGITIEIVGLLIIAAWFPLGLRPGWGTLLNAIEIGLMIELGNQVLPTSDNLVARLAYLAVGLLMIGVGSGIYIGVGLGSGPRDGLMLGLANERITVRTARTLIEATVLVAGILLGGSAGVGTAVFAFGIGPVVHFMLPRLAMRERRMLATAHASAPRL